MNMQYLNMFLVTQVTKVIQAIAHKFGTWYFIGYGTSKF